MAIRQTALVFCLLVTLYAVPVQLGNQIDVCKGKEILCLDDTTVQNCTLDGNGEYIPAGDPFVCDEGEICNTEKDGCAAPPPFTCKTTGTFPDPAVCTQYHKCSVTSSYTQHTLYRCAAGKVYSCKYKICKASSLVTENCSACR